MVQTRRQILEGLDGYMAVAVGNVVHVIQQAGVLFVLARDLQDPEDTDVHVYTNGQKDLSGRLYARVSCGSETSALQTTYRHRCQTSPHAGRSQHHEHAGSRARHAPEIP